MMCHMPPPPAPHEGPGILPSLSNVLYAMRALNQHEDSGAEALRNHVQQQQQQGNRWGASCLAAMSFSSMHPHCAGSRSTTDSAPPSPGDTTSDDERLEEVKTKCVHGANTCYMPQPTGLLAVCPGKASTEGPASNRHAENEGVGEVLESGSLYWPGRKWRERRDKKYLGHKDGRQSAHLRVAILGLQKALTTTAAKSELLTAIRKYTTGETTPEQFAETISDLVDAHHVIVPTGTLVASLDTPARSKRALHADDPKSHSTPSSSTKASRARESKRSRNNNRSPAMRTAAFDDVVVPLKEERLLSPAAAPGNGAWEALVSVCSML